jgi:hypothetical protein
LLWSGADPERVRGRIFFALISFVIMCIFQKICLFCPLEERKKFCPPRLKVFIRLWLWWCCRRKATTVAGSGDAQLLWCCRREATTMVVAPVLGYDTVEGDAAKVLEFDM